MTLPPKAQLMRIYVGENDKYDGKPLYEVIVKEARRQGLAGATVLHGVMGYGKASRIHTSRILRISEDLPVVIEIVDREERLNLMLPFLDERMEDGLVTMEQVTVLSHKPPHD